MAMETTTSAAERRYEAVENWPRLPEGMGWGQVVQVVVDDSDRVLFFQRIDPQVTIFDTDGNYLGRWDDNRGFADIHSVYHGTDADGEYLIIVDRDANTVARTTLDGETVWATKGPMFDRPTDAAVASNGDIYVSDGYGNALVHRLSRDGEVVQTWGSAGAGPGQFQLPHGVWVTTRQGQERVYVCDRENWRIQIFSLDGQYLDELPDLHRPTDIVVDADGIRYVSELAHRVTILGPDDRVIAHLGTGAAQHLPGAFVAPHSVWLDSAGAMYVTEVLEGQRVQKFVARG